MGDFGKWENWGESILRELGYLMSKISGDLKFGEMGDFEK